MYGIFPTFRSPMKKAKKGTYYYNCTLQTSPTKKLGKLLDLINQTTGKSS